MPKNNLVTEPDFELTATNLEPEPTLDEAEIHNIKRRSISGTISYLLRTAVLQGLSLIGALILAAYLSPADYGIYGIAIQITGLLVFFSDIGLAASLVQSKEEPSLTDYRTAFTIQQALAWAIVGIVVIIIATGTLQAKVGTPGILLLLSFALSFPIAGLKTIPAIMMERKMEYSRLVLPEIVENLVFQTILIILAIRGMGVMAYTYAIVVRAIAGVIVMWAIQRWPVGLALSRPSIKKLLGFGVKFQLNDFIARIKDQLFYLFVAKWLTPTQFGYVQWSKNLSVYPYSLTVQNVTAILFPTFARLQDHPSLLKRAIEKSLFFSSLVIFPMLAGLCVFIWPLTQVITKYHKWEPAVLSFIFFALSVAGAGLSNPVNNMLMAIGKINATLKFMILWTVLTWTISPIMLWKFGFNGVAAAAFIISITSYLPIFYMQKFIKFNFWSEVLPQLAATLIMVAVGVLGLQWWSKSLPLFFLGLLITGVTYTLAMLAISRGRLIGELKSLRS